MLYPLNSIIYCNSKTTTAEKCRIKSARFKWDSPNHEYGYTVCSDSTKETFNCPEDAMYATKFLAEAAATEHHDNLKQKYKSNIHSVEELMNFGAQHIKDVKFDQSALDAYKELSQEMLGVTVK